MSAGGKNGRSTWPIKGTSDETTSYLTADKSGASAAEYALILALVGGLIIVGATTLSASITGVFTKLGTTLNTSATNVQTPTAP